MGILNANADSFSDPGARSVDAVVEGAMAMVAAGVLMFSSYGLLPIAAGVGVVGVFATLRAGRMMARDERPTPLKRLQALAVATTYDVARALALVIRVSHRARQ